MRSHYRFALAKSLAALAVLAFLVVTPSPAYATTLNLWVKNTGSNASNCRTKSHPCRTITYALGQAPTTGTHINLLSNINDEVNVTKDNITILSSPSTSHFAIEPTTDTLTAQTPEGLPVNPIVYVGPSRTGVTLKNIVIDGSARPAASGCSPGKGHTGVYVRSAAVTLAMTDVKNISQGPALRGCQNGGAIYVRTDPSAASNVHITGGTVQNYDKNGITCNSVGTTCVINKTTVIGRGPIGSGDAAQNGIQFGFGAGGSVTGVTVHGNNYTVDGEATGILLYEAAPGITIKGSTVYGNDTNIYAQNDLGTAGQDVANLTLANNTVRDATTTNGAGFGIFLDSLSNASVTHNTVHGNVQQGISAAGLQTSTITSNTVTSNGDGIFLGGSGSINATSAGVNVTSNTSNNNTAVGIHADSGAVNNSFNKNTMTNDGGFEAKDESTGGGTAATHNTWTSDHCAGGTSSPSGLCH
jgi:parallel beta-helix repeat protein